MEMKVVAEKEASKKKAKDANSKQHLAMKSGGNGGGSGVGVPAKKWASKLKEGERTSNPSKLHSNSSSNSGSKSGSGGRSGGKSKGRNEDPNSIGTRRSAVISDGSRKVI